MTRAHGLGALLLAAVGAACASAPLPPPPPPPPPPPRPPEAPLALALLAELQDVGVVERWGDAWVADPYRVLEHDTPLVARWLTFTRAQTAERLPIPEDVLARIQALDAQPRARSVAALTRGVMLEEAQRVGRFVRLVHAPELNTASASSTPQAEASTDAAVEGATDAAVEGATDAAVEGATDAAATAEGASDSDPASSEVTASSDLAAPPPAPSREAPPPLSLDGVLASSPSPDGRLVALVLAPTDESPSPHLVVRDWTGALVDGPVADVVPVAPAWEGDDVLLYVLTGRGRSTVRRRFVGAGSDNDPVVLTELRDGDSIRLDAVPNGPAWVEAQRGEERTIWLRTGPTLFRRLAPLPAGPPAVVAGEHIAVADPAAGTLRIARTGRALRAAGWTDHPLPGVSALALCGSRVLAVVRDGLGDALRLVDVVDGAVTPLEPPGLGLVASIDGDANGAWLVWTDPTTPSALAHVGLDGALTWVEHAPLEGGQVQGGRLEDGLDDAPSLVVRRRTLEATIGDARVSFEVAEVRRPGDDVSPIVVAEALGAFGVSAAPAFRAGVAAYLEAGGRWAFVDVRGGGGHASAWHESGRGAGESGAVADLRAAVEALSADGSRVVLYGAAHGGLTAAGLVAREPESVVGVVLHGPVTDLMRFDRFANAALWRSEYGDPSDETAREWLRALSPYHRVRGDQRWPPTLVEAAREGERVSWVHGAKLAARLLETDAAVLHVDERLDDEARRARWARMIVFLRGLQSPE